jgi:hypothetical protein
MIIVTSTSVEICLPHVFEKSLRTTNKIYKEIQKYTKYLHSHSFVTEFTSRNPQKIKQLFQIVFQRLLRENFQSLICKNLKSSVFQNYM